MKKMKKLLIIFGLVLLVNSVNAQWQQIGLAGETIKFLSSHNNSIYAGTTTGLFSSDDNGGSWNQLFNLEVSALAISGDSIFIGIYNGEGILRSVDNGQNWVGLGISSQLHGIGSTLSIIGNKIYAGGNGTNGSAISYDLGLTWNLIAIGGTSPTNQYCFNQNCILAATGMFGQGNGGIYKSIDDGLTWYLSNNGFSSVGGSVTVYSFAKIGTKIFSVYSESGGGTGGIFLSNDEGANWNSVSSGLPLQPVYSIISVGTNLYAGTAGSGAYYSNNYGQSWTNIGLTGYRVNSFLNFNSSIFAGTTSGVFKRDAASYTSDTITFNVVDMNYATYSPRIYYEGTDTLIGVSGNDSIANHYIKYAYTPTYCTVTDTLIINTLLTGLTSPNNINTIKIYPNPANTNITIDYGNFSSMSGYTLKIVNAIGQTVFTTLINQQTSYIDLSTWTGNGIYFVQLIDTQNNTIENRKIVIQ